MEKVATLVRRALKANQVSEAAALEIEKRGEEAFREIAAVVDNEPLPARAKVHAMRLMAQITRHFYPEGKLELIRLAARLARDRSERVRSAACHIAIFGLSTLEDLARLQHQAIIAQKAAKDAVFAALEGGVEARIQGLAQRTIEQRGWGRGENP